MHKLFDDDTCYIVQDEFHFERQDWVGLRRLDQFMMEIYLLQNWLAHLLVVKNLILLFM